MAPTKRALRPLALVIRVELDVLFLKVPAELRGVLAAEFELLRELAYRVVRVQALRVHGAGEGRPGDLQSKPPSLLTETMQATFKRNKKTFPAAGTYIESMQNRHVDFNLQLICLYNEGIPCKYTS